MNKRLLAAVGLSGALFFAAALAHDGHDHDDAPPAAGADSAQRRADGSVFLPKPAQRLIGVRTQPAQVAELAASRVLSGRVIADPNAAGAVAALRDGRVSPPPGGFLLPGAPVKKGQLLAYVTPEGGGADSLAARRLRRLKELADSVPRKLIDQAAAELAGEELRAPLGGVIALSAAQAGQVVTAGQALFRIVDPERRFIEALSYQTLGRADVASTHLRGGGELRLLSAGQVLVNQAQPLLFAAAAPPGSTGLAGLAGLAIGQPVEVVLASRQTAPGIALPAAALVKNPANQDVVWVKSAPETFVARPVRQTPLAGGAIAVSHGLAAGELVVIEGASLINQVR